MKLLNILIVESSYIIIKGLTSILEESGRFNIIDKLPNHNRAESVISENRIDLLFLNPALIDNFYEIITKNPALKVISVISNNDKINNDIFFDNIKIIDRKADIVLNLENIYKNIIDNTESENKEISKREISILRLVALGYTNKEIAEELFISPHTVITHRKHITKKLGIKTVSGLTIYAVLNNIIDLTEAK